MEYLALKDYFQLNESRAKFFISTNCELLSDVLLVDLSEYRWFYHIEFWQNLIYLNSQRLIESFDKNSLCNFKKLLQKLFLEIFVIHNSLKENTKKAIKENNLSDLNFSALEELVDWKVSNISETFEDIFTELDNIFNELVDFLNQILEIDFTEKKISIVSKIRRLNNKFNEYFNFLIWFEWFAIWSMENNSKN